jgi:glycine dehydrogenase
MLKALGKATMEELIDATVPQSIRLQNLEAFSCVGDGLTETEALAELRSFAQQNRVWKTYIGMGYHNTITPPVILRNVLEDPRWYTPYTPYQAEISQGRLEALLNFQTMVADLTGMEIANASMLDEATAAAEALSMCHTLSKVKDGCYFVADHCHPQTIEVVKTRALPLGIKVIVGDFNTYDFSQPTCGALLQMPDTLGFIHDLRSFIDRAHAAGAMVVTAADILALTLITPPGELGADIAVGSTQRFGVPMGYGGPHAAYLATREAYKRNLPGRLVGVSKDADGRPAYRLTLQTREQHIRRDKATSNICTAQVLLAVAASMYAVYHGPEGLREIAETVRTRTETLASALAAQSVSVTPAARFDTLHCTHSPVPEIRARAEAAEVNLRYIDDSSFTISLDETTTEEDIALLVRIVTGSDTPISSPTPKALPPWCTRTSPYLTHPVFNSHRSETQMLRYLNQLQLKDLSLAESMIPLGSCTMKLNATAEMIPVTWPEFGAIHPFAPAEQAKGYRALIDRLERMLCEITGFSAVSLQPNAGSQGEYAGLLVIHEFHKSNGEHHRNVCLIPQSAHGTNPASAAMVGMKIVVIACDSNGNIDLQDLKSKASEHAQNLAALMVTYPSTHGVFEEAIREICDIVHQHGGQVYMDGANMNAQVGLCRPGDFGPDVCHLNLHKTFCIPHGGGGPGMGPIGVAAHLAPFLPGHPLVTVGGTSACGAVSAAPWGSPSILPISYMYIRMMGARGLRAATETAILNANYMAHRLEPYFPVLYRGENGYIAHECIVDVRPLKAATGVEVEDVAKRLMDYGFHAPTVSFPVSGTLMIEPTESESLQEIDRFCDAMTAIRAEIDEIAGGEADRTDNVLKNAPHTALQVCSDSWTHPYSRTKAAYPAPWLRQNKYWTPVARIDSVYGDRNVYCSCPPMEAWTDADNHAQTR